MAVLIWQFSGVRERLWNLENVAFFLPVTFQTTPNMRKAKDTRTKILQCLQPWEQGCYAGFVDDTVAEDLSGTLSQASDPETEQRSFNGKILSGQLR